jgi:hypothetical protein
MLFNQAMMFNQAVHRRVLQVLQALNADFLAACKIYKSSFQQCRNPQPCTISIAPNVTLDRPWSVLSPKNKKLGNV